MLTEEEQKKVVAMVNDITTPKKIRDLLEMVGKCERSIEESRQRLEYLEKLTRKILETPEGKLETVSYIPETCPAVPKLASCNEPVEYPIPTELQGILYKGAIEGGHQLLTTLEAEAMLTGIRIGSSREREQLLAIILMISIGQRIREQRET